MNTSLAHQVQKLKDAETAYRNVSVADVMEMQYENAKLKQRADELQYKVTQQQDIIGQLRKDQESQLDSNKQFIDLFAEREQKEKQIIDLSKQCEILDFRRSQLERETNETRDQLRGALQQLSTDKNQYLLQIAELLATNQDLREQLDQLKQNSALLEENVEQSTTAASVLSSDLQRMTKIAQKYEAAQQEFDDKCNQIKKHFSSQKLEPLKTRIIHAADQLAASLKGLELTEFADLQLKNIDNRQRSKSLAFETAGVYLDQDQSVVEEIGIQLEKSAILTAMLRETLQTSKQNEKLAAQNLAKYEIGTKQFEKLFEKQQKLVENFDREAKGAEKRFEVAEKVFLMQKEQFERELGRLQQENMQLRLYIEEKIMPK